MICWNEEFILPFTLRYYSSFVDKIILYDNHCTDSSISIAKSFPQVEIRTLNTNDQFCEDSLILIKNQAWKESRDKADWVIVCDVDEILYYPNIKSFLTLCKQCQITLPLVNGFEMVCTDEDIIQPLDLIDQVKYGLESHFYSKNVIFNPNLIEDINYYPGCHQCSPTGLVTRFIDNKLKLLHYSYLGLNYSWNRKLVKGKRLSKKTINQGFAFHWQWNYEAHCEAYGDLLSKAKKVI